MIEGVKLRQTDDYSPNISELLEQQKEEKQKKLEKNINNHQAVTVVTDSPEQPHNKGYRGDDLPSPSRHGDDLQAVTFKNGEFLPSFQILTMNESTSEPQNTKNDDKKASFEKVTTSSRHGDDLGDDLKPLSVKESDDGDGLSEKFFEKNIKNKNGNNNRFVDNKEIANEIPRVEKILLDRKTNTPSIDEVIKVMKTQVDWNDVVTLSMEYFNGCDIPVLHNILKALVSQGYVEWDDVDSYRWDIPF